MATAQETFVDRLTTFGDALTADAVQTQGLNEVAWNERSRVLRNGLMVVGFAILEDFIRTRSDEVLKRISGGGIPFQSFPPELQRAATEEAVRGLQFQIPLRKAAGEDTVAFVQDASQMIASTKASPYAISSLGVAWSQSNVTAESVANILRIVAVDNAWNQMTALASRIGFGGLPLRDAYVNATRRRHQAAHQASSNIAMADLQGYVRDATAIALAFDCLLSRAGRLLMEGHTGVLTGEKVDGSLVALRFVDQRPGAWAELPEGAKRAYRLYPDRASALIPARQRCVSARASLVIRDGTLVPVDWRTTDL